MLDSITVFGKFVKLIPNRNLETFGFHHSIEGAFLLTYTNFRPIDSFPSQEKANVLRTICLHSYKMSNVEYRLSIGHQVFHPGKPEYH